MIFQRNIYPPFDPFISKRCLIHTSVMIDVCVSSLGHTITSILEPSSHCCLVPSWGIKALILHTLQLGWRQPHPRPVWCPGLLPAWWGSICWVVSNPTPAHKLSWSSRSLFRALPLVFGLIIQSRNHTGEKEVPQHYPNPNHSSSQLLILFPPIINFS